MRLRGALLGLALLALCAPVLPQTLPFPGPGQGAAPTIGTPTSFGHTTATATPSSYTLTTTAGIVAGNLLIVSVAINTNTSLTVASISDGTNSACYTKAINDTTNANTRIEIWSCPNASTVASGATLTVTLSAVPGGGQIAIETAQVSGVRPSAPLDKTNSAFNAASLPSVSSGTLTISNEILFGSGASVSGSTWTTASGFTGITFDGIGGMASGLDYEIVAATTSITYAPSANGSTRNATALATFKGF